MTRLAEIEARVKAATKGPWERSLEYDDESGELVPALGLVGPEYLQSGYEHYGPVRDTVVLAGFGPHCKHRANLDFIQHARDDVPWLIARVRELERELEARGK